MQFFPKRFQNKLMLISVGNASQFNEDKCREKRYRMNVTRRFAPLHCNTCLCCWLPSEREQANIVCNLIYFIRRFLSIFTPNSSIYSNVSNTPLTVKCYRIKAAVEPFLQLQRSDPFANQHMQTNHFQTQIDFNGRSLHCFAVKT